MGLRLWCPSSLLILLYLLQFNGNITTVQATNNITTINIGVIVNEKSRIGKEQKVAVQIAVHSFNNKSNQLKLSLHLRNSDGNPLQAASVAAELAKMNEIKAIIGMETWQEAALVAQVGNQYQLPILSLATVPATLPLAPQRWPFLVQMASNYAQQVKCISALVKYYNWPRVIAVYEDDGYAGTSLILDLLSQTLQDVGSVIEYRLALPPLGVVSNPEAVVLKELVKVLSTQSRVFLVLQPSLPLAIHLFREAKNMGLIGRETAWIFTDSISGLLHSINTTAISYMEGALGIKSYYSETGKEYEDFFFRFWLEFPDGLNPQPGIHAVRAHDAVTAITKAIEQLGNETPSLKKLMQSVLSSNFNGLSGNISFKGGELSDTQVRVINVMGKGPKGYKELDFWSPRNGFSKRPEIGRKREMSNETEVLHGVVKWPGDVKDVPKGWAMPTNTKPMKIGVPGDALFQKSVTVEWTRNPSRTTYFGFCIDVFQEAVKLLEENYAFPYEFEPFYGTYDELINCVYNKTFDVMVGDVTILANRSKHVDFTQPYAKSGMLMIVPFKSRESQKALLFMKPFTMPLWLVMGAVFAYTGFTVWALEHHSNPEFAGPQKKQLTVVLSFIFFSLFFAHKERIRSSYTRIVVVVWLFVVFVLIQSYTANLTSMLTVPLLKPKITDVNQVIKNNMIVGCDGDSFVKDYLINVLEIPEENIRHVNKEKYYHEFLDNSTIAAAFLELPFERVFLNQYCKSFTHTKETFRFEGLGFVFQKGSPITVDMSKAILRLSESGVLKALDDKWYSPSPECATTSTDNDVESLSIQGFWVLYLLTGASSTICFLVFLIRLLKDYAKETMSPSNVNNTFREQLARLWRYYDRGGQFRTGQVSNTLTLAEWAPQWSYASPAQTSEHYPEPPSHHSTPSLLEMSDRIIRQHQIS